MRVSYLPLNSSSVNYKSLNDSNNITKHSLSLQNNINFTSSGGVVKTIGRVISKPLVEGFIWEGLGLASFFTGVFAFIFNNSWDLTAKGGLTGLGVLFTVGGLLIKRKAQRVIEDRTVF